MGAQVQHHDRRMNDVERQLKEIAVGRGSGTASSVRSSEPHTEPARTGAQHPPKQHRSVLVVGGFLHDTERPGSQRMVGSEKSGIHTWDRPNEEVLLSKRVSLAIRTLRTRAVERVSPAKVPKMGSVEAGNVAGVWFKKLRTHARIHIVKCRNGDRTIRRSPGVCNASKSGAATLGGCGRSWSLHAASRDEALDFCAS